jgi:hypothetical protein
MDIVSEKADIEAEGASAAPPVSAPAQPGAETGCVDPALDKLYKNFYAILDGEVSGMIERLDLRHPGELRPKALMIAMMHTLDELFLWNPEFFATSIEEIGRITSVGMNVMFPTSRKSKEKYLALVLKAAERHKEKLAMPNDRLLETISIKSGKAPALFDMVIGQDLKTLFQSSLYDSMIAPVVRRSNVSIDDDFHSKSPVAAGYVSTRKNESPIFNHRITIKDAFKGGSHNIKVIVHEFAHAYWEQNGAKLGLRRNIHSDFLYRLFNESFATAIERFASMELTQSWDFRVSDAKLNRRLAALSDKEEGTKRRILRENSDRMLRGLLLDRMRDKHLNEYYLGDYLRDGIADRLHDMSSRLKKLELFGAPDNIVDGLRNMRRRYMSFSGEDLAQFAGMLVNPITGRRLLSDADLYCATFDIGDEWGMALDKSLGEMSAGDFPYLGGGMGMVPVGYVPMQEAFSLDDIVEKYDAANREFSLTPRDYGR